MILERLFTRDKSLVNRCARCKGLLLWARIPYEDIGLWSCALCGNQVDSTIMRNRALTEPPPPRNEQIRRFPVSLSTS